MPEAMLAAVRHGWEARAPLHADPSQTAYRVFHGYGEGWPGLTIDRWGEVLRVRHGHEHTDALDALATLLHTELLPGATVLAHDGRDPRGVRLMAGQPAPKELIVRDAGLAFVIEPHTPSNPGLYLDARPARAWIRDHAAGRRVLNLFAWTGSLGMAAAAGGAQSVTHVEQQKRAVERLRRNLELNALRIDDRDLVRDDLYKVLRRAARDGRTYQAIIVDPPPQVPAQRGHHPRGQDYATLVPLVVSVLSPGGWLLCTFNRRDQTQASSEHEIIERAGGDFKVTWRGTSGADFPEADVDAKLRFSAFTRP